MSELIQQQFDYEAAGIAEGDAAKLEKTAVAIEKQQDVARECWWQMAKLVAEAHDLLASKDKTKGMFGKWVKDRCGFTPQTANKLVRANKLLDHGKVPFHHISQDAAAFLADEDIDQETVDRCVKLAKAKVHVTPAVAKGILALHRSGADDKVVGELCAVAKAKPKKVTKRDVERIAETHDLTLPEHARDTQLLEWIDRLDIAIRKIAKKCPPEYRQNLASHLSQLTREFDDA